VSARYAQAAGVEERLLNRYYGRKFCQQVSAKRRNFPAGIYLLLKGWKKNVRFELCSCTVGFATCGIKLSG
jgi:hypothetical protein